MNTAKTVALGVLELAFLAVLLVGIIQAASEDHTASAETAEVR